MATYYTKNQINQMSKDKLVGLINREDLNVKESTPVKKMREMVIAQLDKKGMIFKSAQQKGKENKKEKAKEAAIEDDSNEDDEEEEPEEPEVDEAQTITAENYESSWQSIVQMPREELVKALDGLEVETESTEYEQLAHDLASELGINPFENMPTIQEIYNMDATALVDLVDDYLIPIDITKLTSLDEKARTDEQALIKKLQKNEESRQHFAREVVRSLNRLFREYGKTIDPKEEASRIVENLTSAASTDIDYWEDRLRLTISELANTENATEVDNSYMYLKLQRIASILHELNLSKYVFENYPDSDYEQKIELKKSIESELLITCDKAINH